jgi:hypothetical protein
MISILQEPSMALQSDWSVRGAVHYLISVGQPAG